MLQLVMAFGEPLSQGNEELGVRCLGIYIYGTDLTPHIAPRSFRLSAQMLGISDKASAMIPGRIQSSSIITKGFTPGNRNEIYNPWPLQRPGILELYVQILT